MPPATWLTSRTARTTRLPWRAATVALSLFALGAGCSASGPGEYAGTWICSDGGNDLLAITSDSDGVVVKDEDGETYRARRTDEGKLAVQLDEDDDLWANLAIDPSTGEVLCPACGCKRFSTVVDGKSYGKALVTWRCASSKETHNTPKSSCESMEKGVLERTFGGETWCVREADAKRCMAALKEVSQLDLAKAGGPFSNFPEPDGKTCSPEKIAVACGGM